jgi:hypothetical protein
MGQPETKKGQNDEGIDKDNREETQRYLVPGGGCQKCLDGILAKPKYASQYRVTC